MLICFYHGARFIGETKADKFEGQGNNQSQKRANRSNNIPTGQTRKQTNKQKVRTRDTLHFIASVANFWRFWKIEVRVCAI